MTETEYKAKIDKLLNDIDIILGQRDIKEIPMEERAALSAKIMARIREEYIYVKNSYIDYFKEKEVRVTINPYSPDVKLELGDGEREGTAKGEYCRIYAYSFGPFRPRYFFDCNSIRFLWIIKEPYLCDEMQMVGRAEGYAQDMHYNQWVEVKKNDTVRNIVKITRLILMELGIQFTESDEDMNKVMNHICILEVNHFPGLGLFYDTDSDKYNTLSDNGLIEEWASLNLDLVGLLKEYYNADVVIGGHTLEMLYPLNNFENVFNAINDQNQPLKIFNDEIVEWSFIDTESNEEVINPKTSPKNVGKNINYLSKSNRIYIQTNHPSIYSIRRTKISGARIKNYLLKTRGDFAI